MTYESNLSDLNYFIDYYTSYFDYYLVAFDTGYNYFQNCHTKNATKEPAANAKEEEFMKDTCVRGFADAALASPNRQNFYNLSFGYINLDETSQSNASAEGLINDQMALDNALHIASALYLLERQIHQGIISNQKLHDDIDKEEAAKELRFAMTDPSFDATRLTAADLKTLQDAGLDSKAIEEAKDLASTGLDPINGVFDVLRNEQNEPIRLSLARDCRKEIADINQC
jgi:hypothetical protein